MLICVLTFILKLLLVPRDEHHGRIFLSKKLYVNRKTEQSISNHKKFKLSLCINKFCLLEIGKRKKP